MSIIKRIRKAVRTGRFIFTDHALQEVEADGLLVEDVVRVLLKGELESQYSEDVRGPRYIIRGEIHDIVIEVVCRFRGDGTLLIIITVYVVNENE